MTFAHDPVGPSDLWTAWRPDPGVIGLLAATALLYRQGLLGRGAVALGRAPAAFAAGMVALAVALSSPLDAAASALFSAHMLQHLVLILVAAPLLAASRPVLVFGRTLPRRWRRALLRLGRPASGGRRVVEALGHPVTLWAVGTVVLWAWHLPVLYEAALEHDALHGVEHLTLLGTAAVVWAAVLGRGRRTAAPPVAVLLLFATSLQSSALGAVLTFAPAPLYSVHESTARLWGLSALEDQQLAGGMMWMPPGLVYLAVMAVVLARWLASLPAGAPRPEVAREAP